MSNDSAGTGSFGGQDRPDEISSGPMSATPPWQPTTSILPRADVAGESSTPRGSSRRWTLAGGAGVVVLALVGGVTYAVGALSGGGAQPADSLPSGAFGYVSIDLDPAAGQKVDGVQFVRSFPSMKDKVPADGDVRKTFFQAVAKDAGWPGVTYDRDVAPWIGKRIALAAYPGSGTSAAATPTVVVALQVTDKDAAEAGLARLEKASGSSAGAPGRHVGWAFSGDYALLSDTPAHARQAAARVAGGTLGSDPDFAADLAAMPDGVATAWVDGGRAATVLGQGVAALPGGGLLGAAADLGGLAAGSAPAAEPGAPASSTGRTTVVARFAGAHVFEVRGRVTGASTAGWSTHAVTGVADLPTDSVFALGVADPDLLVRQTYASLASGLKTQGMNLDDMTTSFADSYGITLPADLETLLGHNLVLSVSGGAAGVPAIGARVTTGTAAAEAVVAKARKALVALGLPQPITTNKAGDDLVIASSEAAARRLSGGASRGTLGSTKAFTDALPDLGTADIALWVNPAAAQAAVGSGSDDRDLAVIAGLGLTASSRSHASGSDGTTTFTVRLVTR